MSLALHRPDISAANWTELYGPDIAFGLTHPIYVDLKPNCTEADLVTDISVRRSLMIGASQKFPETKIDRFKTDRELDYPASVYGSMMDQLCCAIYSNPTMPQVIRPGWARNNLKFRKAVGQEYIATQINSCDPRCQDNIIKELYAIRKCAQPSDFLLIVIEGKNTENLSWHYNPRPIEDYKKLVQDLHQVPGRKFIIDLSDCCGDLNEQFLQKSIDQSSSYLGMITSASLGQTPTAIHNQSVWNYLVNQILFQHQIANIDLRHCISENGGDVLIPQIRSDFSLVI